jgi:hypothetical protein
MYMRWRRLPSSTLPAGSEFLQWQASFDDIFLECYNDERPHLALDMRSALKFGGVRS